MIPPDQDWKQIANGQLIRSVASSETRFAESGPSRCDVCDLGRGRVLVSLKQDDDSVPPFLIALEQTTTQGPRDFVDLMFHPDTNTLELLSSHTDGEPV